MFQTLHTTPAGGRRGRLTLPHGTVETPVFMPVGTAATVKAVPQQTLETLGHDEAGAQIILANTYHLYLRPGHELIARMGGVHKFMSWNRPMLTDSGGFQVFSLSELRKVTPDGVEFRSHLDGSKHFFSPEHSIAVQIALGADIIMVFDECVEHPATYERTRDSLALTHAWAERSAAYFAAHKHEVPWANTQNLSSFAEGGGPAVALSSFAEGGGPASPLSSFAERGGPAVALSSFAEGGGPASPLSSFAERGGPAVALSSFAEGGGPASPLSSFAEGGGPAVALSSFAEGGGPASPLSSFAEGGGPAVALPSPTTPAHQSLFGIVQGGMFPDLRRESAERLVELDLPGYAIGGLAVGEPREVTRDMIARTLEWLPRDKPRYVMGVGYPDEIEEYARMGVDMMDCVLPTRAGRHGLVFIRESGQIRRMNIKKLEYAEDPNPIDPTCTCPTCQRYSRAYLRHLFSSGEPLAATLLSVHNLAFYLDTMARVRADLSGTQS